MVGLKLSLDGAWSDLQNAAGDGLDTERVTWLRDGTTMSVLGLREGTVGGKPTVAIRMDLPDGKTVVAETTLALFLTVADALKTKYGDPRPIFPPRAH